MGRKRGISKFSGANRDLDRRIKPYIEFAPITPVQFFAVPDCPQRQFRFEVFVLLIEEWLRRKLRVRTAVKYLRKMEAEQKWRRDFGEILNLTFISVSISLIHQMLLLENKR